MGTGSFPGVERPGRDADPSPASSAVGHERVELYLYSPYGPYGLYRTSAPVQWCTHRTHLTTRKIPNLYFPFTFPEQIYVNISHFCLRATCPNGLTPLDLVTLAMLGTVVSHATPCDVSTAMGAPSPPLRAAPYGYCRRPTSCSPH